MSSHATPAPPTSPPGHYQWLGPSRGQWPLPSMQASFDTQGGWVRAGKNNLYFQDLVRLANDSGLARACIRIKSMFIKGQGWKYDSDQAAAQRFFTQILQPEVLERCATDLAYFNGFALRVRYNALAEVSAIEHVDYASVRLAIPNSHADGDISENASTQPTHAFVSSQWHKQGSWHRMSGQAQQAGKPILLPLYTADRQATMAQIRQHGRNYQGQLLYVREYCPSHHWYAPPSWAAADHRLQVDAGVGSFHADNLANGFFPGMMLYFPGQDWDTLAPDGRPKREAFQEWFDTKFKGTRAAGEVLKLYGGHADDVPRPVNFQPQINSEMFLSLEKNTLQYIPIAFQVPSALLGVPQAGKLGSNQQIRDEVELFQNNVIGPEQDRLVQALAMLQLRTPGWQGPPNLQIQQRRALNSLPAQVFEHMTPEEIRIWAGLPAKPCS